MGTAPARCTAMPSSPSMNHQPATVGMLLSSIMPTTSTFPLPTKSPTLIGPDNPTLYDRKPMDSTDHPPALGSVPSRRVTPSRRIAKSARPSPV